LTATAPAPPQARQQPDPQRLAVVDGMLDRAQLDLLVPRDQAARALARTFARHPIGQHTAALVGQALTFTRQPEHERPPAEQAVRRLIARGQPAYRRAIQAEAERMAAAAAARPARLGHQVDRLRPVVDRDGHRAAQLVTDHWRQHNRPLSPLQLARELDVPTGDSYALARLLIRAGWLELHHKRLKPGPRARRSTP
jgi:hypothetical protein